MFNYIAKKLTKPASPKTIEELMAAGGRLVFHVPVTDANGRVLPPEEVRELHIKNARMKIASHEGIVAKAEGLRTVAELEPLVSEAMAKGGAAAKHWELMQRRYFGGMAEMHEVEQAQHAFNVAAEAARPLNAELSTVKAAEVARAEINRLKAEYKL
ncbi:hypothetical protein M3A49_02350 [Paraburkholderia sp. CNPSo 3076]|uniref:hypothetical protein n=1 Tax=Paraburkholderia sp. CNPSo 3076 TaxID=2940936 RepID=UPI0022553B62|nr:hypothetical protein [Paraburkholderia sp. CNPSo 3076]MCX5538350.1 hypothetical protein [Paraburkholderia sp. CNPSo 3076]